MKVRRISALTKAEVNRGILGTADARCGRGNPWERSRAQAGLEERRPVNQGGTAEFVRSLGCLRDFFLCPEITFKKGEISWQRKRSW